jgi:hypothetical protein
MTDCPTLSGMKKRKEDRPHYPEAFGNAYQTLGIILGAEDFDEKMEALKYLCEYYQRKRKELDKQ